MSSTCLLVLNSRVDAKYRYRKDYVVYTLSVFYFISQNLQQLHAKYTVYHIKWVQLYSIFQKSLKCNLRHTDALPDLRAHCRAHAQSSLSPVALQHTTHPASMGNSTIFLLNNSLHCVSNAKGICQNQRTCPKGRNRFEQYLLIWSTSAVLFLNTVWNRKGTRTHMLLI